MTRNLKTLGLALVAIFAMSAMAASAASAQQGKLTSDGLVTLTGSEVGGLTENSLTSFGGQTRCPGSTYTGHKVITHAETTHREFTKESKHPLLSNLATEATLTPHYAQANCVSISGGSEFSSTVDMNGCDYVLRVGTTTPPLNTEGTYGVTAEVVCPTGGHIQVTQFSGEAHGFRICSVTVGPQGPLTGAHITNQPGTGHFLIKGTFTGIKATRSGLCGAATEEAGQFHINATVKGHNAAGGTTPVSITD